MRRPLSLLSALFAVVPACAPAPDRRVEEGCPPGVPCETVPWQDPEGLSVLPRRGLEPWLDALPLVEVPRRHPEIGHLRGHGSLSIGSPTTGFVVGCRTLPREGPHHAILEEHSHRGTACATDDLVEAILSAAADVDRVRPGARLAVGNLGRGGGGGIPWSVSHHSGRDADLGFFLLDPGGKPHLPRTLVPLNRKGMGEIDGVEVRFDTPRNWLLVRSLITNPSVSVQWLFVSRSLRRMLLDFARRRETPALVRRAEEVLAQPARSRPHNDHLHLRIACPADDVLEGCRDIGSQRSWFRDPSARVADRVEELLRLVRSRDARVRADVATVLGRIGTAEARREVLRRLDDDDEIVRRAAAAALADGGVDGIEDDLVKRLGSETDGVVSASILAALDLHVARWHRPSLLVSLLAIDRPYTVDLGVFEVRRSVGDWAEKALGRLPLGTAVRLMIGVLEAGTLPTGRAANVLREWTGADPDEGAPDAAATVLAWRGWWRTHKGRSPREWWAEALRRRGLEVSASTAARVLDDSAASPGREVKRWFVEAVGAALGIRLPPGDIEPLAVVLRRATSPAGRPDVEAPEPDPAPNGTTGPSEGPEPGASPPPQGARGPRTPPEAPWKSGAGTSA